MPHPFSRRRLVLVIGIWLAMPWGLAAFNFWQMHRQEHREAKAHSQSLALAMAEYTQRSVLEG